MEFLSIMSKGTTQEKILWSFDFFDIDRNGYIERQEMIKVWNKWKMLHRKRDIFFILVIINAIIIFCTILIKKTVPVTA